MKLHILSDLHLELTPFEPPATAADVVVLAGDIDVGWRGLDWAATAFAGKPVLYVAGNHEYYRRGIAEVDSALKAEAATSANVQVLQGDEIVLGDIRFLGTTLWTDFALHGAE